MAKKAESTQTSTPQARREQLTICISVSELPPSKYLELCDTDDRKQYWHECRAGFTNLAAALAAYFLEAPELMEQIPAELHEPFILWRDRYLALYAMLCDGWKYIQAAATEKELPLPDSPTQLLIEIISSDSKEIILKAFPEWVTGNAVYEFSTRREYNFRREHSHVVRLSKAGADLTSEEKKKILKHLKELQKRSPWDKFSNMERFCVRACTQAAQSDFAIKQRVKAFEAADRDYESDLYGAIHPRKKDSGFAFIKGKKLHSSPGGVYQ